jgi:hypothetical protein
MKRTRLGRESQGNGGDVSTGFARSRGRALTSEQLCACANPDTTMLTAGSSTGSRPRPRDSFQSSVRKSLRLLRNSESNDSYRREDFPVSAESAFTQAGLSSNQPSGARTFIQRTIALFRRQSRQAPKRRLSPLPRVRPDTSHHTGRDGSTLLTRLVLPSTDDVSFSSSSFFRRVEEVRALNAVRSEATLVTSLPSTLLPPRPPPRPPRRRPPPPVDEIFSATPPALSLPPSICASTKAQQDIPPKSAQTDLDSALELRTLATTLDTRDSPPLVQQQLRASPSIKSTTRTSLPVWSTSQSTVPAPALGRDPLTELLAVSDELKAMRNFDSEDLLYMSDVPPFPSLPPTLHAFLDAPGTSLHILEMEIHRESETFLGVPIPCIVVTSESDPLPPIDALATPAVPLPQPPEVDMLAPPPTTYRVRTDAENQLPALVDSDQELGSPPAPAPPYEDAEESSPTQSWECGASVDLNSSWEALSLADSPSASGVSTKPVAPTAPKPGPLLRRHQRSLLRRVLGGVRGGSDTSTGRDKSWCVPSHKQKRKRISKEVIGPPRPLSPTT